MTPPGGGSGRPRGLFAIIRRLCTTSTSVGAWRSLVARIVRDDEVGGSNPLAPTITTRCPRDRLRFIVDRGVVPGQHAECPQGVPPARRAIWLLEPEVHRPRMGVLEQPTAIRLLLGAYSLDRLIEPRVGHPTPGEVVGGLEEVVVPPRRVGELRPLRPDLLAGAQGPEQATLEQVLVTPCSRLPDLVGASGRALPPKEGVDHVERAGERSRRVTRLGPAIPATIRQLVGE